VELNLLTNYPEKVIYMDYTDAMNGFEVPSVSQTKNGMFDLTLLSKMNQNQIKHYITRFIIKMSHINSLSLIQNHLLFNTNLLTKTFMDHGKILILDLKK
jgi:hypothetical protein